MSNNWPGGYTLDGLPIGYPITSNKRKSQFFDSSAPKRQGLTSSKSRLSYNPIMPQSSRFSASRGYNVNNFSGYRRSSWKKRRVSGPYGVLGDGGTRHIGYKNVPAESKIDDNITASIPITTAGVFATGVSAAINQITQGVANNQRLGSKIVIRSLAYRFDFDINSAATIPCAIRAIIFWDRQPNAYSVALSPADLLATASYLSYNNVANSSRFVVLRNHNIALAPNGPQTAFIEGFVKLNMNSFYVNTVSDNPTTGALMCLFIGDQAANTPAVVASFRTRFIDP